jgi:hypothetical protein
MTSGMKSNVSLANFQSVWVHSRQSFERLRGSAMPYGRNSRR